MEKTSRIAGLDIIRAFAVVFVVFVHAFLKLGFYTTPVSGIAFFGYIAARSVFFLCVPLFLLLTGYLQCNKKCGKQYYKSLLPILGSYVFISILCLAVAKYGYKDDITVLGGVLSILDFTANSYAWYVEMFIGLFLLAPFFNILYHGIATKTQKRILIAALLFLTALPVFFYSFHTPRGNALRLLPMYWENLYPVTYYFLGCFLREYQPKIKKPVNAVLFLGALGWVSAALFWANHQRNFSWRILGGYGGITTVILSVLFFLFFYDMEIPFAPLRAIAKQLSLRAFDIYLFSNIFDLLVYTYYFKTRAPSVGHFIYTAPAVLALSFAAAQIKRLLFLLVKLPFSRKKRRERGA